MNIYAKRVGKLGTENAFKIGDDIKRCEQMGMRVVKLNLGEPDFDSAENINEVAIGNIRAGNSHYADPQGILPLRQSIARQILQTRGVEVDPGQIVVTTGAKPPISYTMMTYVDPGDEVIYPSPGFPIYESWVTFVDAVPVPLHLKEEKGFRFDAADLARLITAKTKVLIVNSPSNPTGGILTHKDLEDIAAAIKNKADPSIRVFSDEVYEHIIFDGREHESILSISGMASRTILVSGHSKTYAMTGWRLGYAVLPTIEEAMIFRQLNINTISCTPPFIQEAGKEALDNEKNPAIVSAMVKEFERRRTVVVEGLNRIEGIHCRIPDGAFYVFPNISGICATLGITDAYEKLPLETKKWTSPSTLFQMFALYHHGVATIDRRSFGAIGSEGKHYLRLSTATDMESLKEGIRRIETASKDRAGFRTFMTKGDHLF
ncbi:MAG: aminotransferase class I/II-fold pyridoxal phosphate-dependent enzyme [Proteobacteria bacterium]|nr:aminotransferase class I/II-fold pyridoxal phosphate-dependent enzyme [Pseudomonadota bacterium]